MRRQIRRPLALVLFVILPGLFAALTYRAAWAYLNDATDLRTYIYTGFHWPSSRPDFLVEANLSITKLSFSDRWLERNFTFVISGDVEPRFSLAFLQREFSSWSITTTQTFPVPLRETVCTYHGETDECVHYYHGFIAQSLAMTTLEWSEFEIVTAPTDRYSADYCFWLDRPFAFHNIALRYSLPPGYMAGIGGYVEKTRDRFPGNLTSEVPSVVNQISCFQIVIMREPIVFLPLVLYAMLPPFILYYVGLITLTTVGSQSRRLQIYVGALFSTFAYFLSLRALLQSFISWIELLVMIGMILWILFEASTVLLKGRLRPHRPSYYQ